MRVYETDIIPASKSGKGVPTRSWCADLGEGTVIPRAYYVVGTPDDAAVRVEALRRLLLDVMALFATAEAVLAKARKAERTAIAKADSLQAQLDSATADLASRVPEPEPPSFTATVPAVKAPPKPRKKAAK